MFQPTLTPAAFAAKWRGVTTTEKASAQSHFIDLCRMLGEPTPHEADPTGEHYAFEKYVTKAGGGEGFADVWKRGFFAWEYGVGTRTLRPSRPSFSSTARRHATQPDTRTDTLGTATEPTARCVHSRARAHGLG